MEQQSNHSPARRNSTRRFRLQRLLFPLVFAVVVAAILADRFPAVRDARDRIFNPAEFQARKACHAVALAAAERPAYARVVTAGEVHATQEAQYVKGVRVGEMGPAGAEVTYEFSCYVNAEGNVVNTHKQPSAPAAGN